MFHLTLFGGTDVRLDGGGKFVLTVFGGTDVHRQTLAKRILREKHMAEDSKRTPAPDPLAQFGLHSGSRRRRPALCFVFTMFGGVEIKPPSLAEEFMDMRELVSSGLITSREWDELVGRIYQMGETEGYASLTIFGSLEESHPPEEEELKKIRSARELGMINDDEETALRSVVGRDPQQIRMLLRNTAFA